MSKYKLDNDLHVAKAIHGMEVGDDRVDYSEYPLILAVALAIQQQVYRMITSEEDTCISKRHWNFCEVTSIVPCDPKQNLEYARSGSFNHIGYIDAPVLRTILDVQKADRSHSSTSVGKTAMMSSRIRTIRKESRTRMHIATWIQDGCLRTSHIPDPKYLHQLVGGSGHIPLWNVPENTYLYVKAYKNGTYDRVYGSAINELRIALSDMEVGRAPSVVLCQRLREKQEYLHGTYAEKVLILDRKTISQESTEVKPLYKALAPLSGLRGVENRLIQTRRVMQGKDALVELQRTQRILEALFNTNGVRESERIERIKNFQKRKEYEEALQGNSAFQRLLNRDASDNDVIDLLKQGFLPSVGGVVELTRQLIDFMVSGQSECYTIDDIPLTGDVYLTSEVSVEATMRVPNIPLKPRYGSRAGKVQLTEARLGLWQVSKSQEEWADDIVEQLTLERARTGRPLVTPDVLPRFSERMEWVRDDTHVIRDVINLTEKKPPGSVLLVTKDYKLCRRVAKTAGTTVIALSPESVIINNKREVWSEESAKDVCRSLLHAHRENLEHVAPKVYDVIVDIGNFKAHAEHMANGVNDHGHKTGAVYRCNLLEADFTLQGRRSLTEFVLLNGANNYPIRIISPHSEVRSTIIRPTEDVSSKPKRRFEKLRSRFTGKRG
jgi:hypothetical protein